MKTKQKRRQSGAVGLLLDVRKRLVHLTARQREIALLVSNGGRNKEVADRLNISERTVKAHLTVIFIKLGLSDRLRLSRLVNKYLVNGCRMTSH